MTVHAVIELNPVFVVYFENNLLVGLESRSIAGGSFEKRILFLCLDHPHVVEPLALYSAQLILSSAEQSLIREIFL